MSDEPKILSRSALPLATSKNFLLLRNLKSYICNSCGIKVINSHFAISQI